jgi:hypothetical protein
MKKYLYILFFVVSPLVIFSCENVEDGYRIDYPETPAKFSVTLLTPDRGSVGENIVFSVQALSDYDIKSLVVNTSVSGGDGTGFTVGSTQVDPLIDHAFGTIQKNVKELDLNYTYLVANDSIDPVITFTLVDEYGSKTIKHNLFAIPSIVQYDSVVMFAQTNALADGFASSDGVVYHDLTDYADLTTVNEAIQESLDIVFLIQDDTDAAMLVAPYNGNFYSGMAIRNKTLFKRLPGVTSDEFNQLTSASLSSITEDAEVKRGTTDIWDIKAGEIIGFRTDIGSSNPYHFGMLRINAIHPANSEYYKGISYTIEMDVVTQK